MYTASSAGNERSVNIGHTKVISVDGDVNLCFRLPSLQEQSLPPMLLSGQNLRALPVDLMAMLDGMLGHRRLVRLQQTVGSSMLFDARLQAVLRLAHVHMMTCLTC